MILERWLTLTQDLGRFQAKLLCPIIVLIKLIERHGASLIVSIVPVRPCTEHLHLGVLKSLSKRACACQIKLEFGTDDF